MEQCDTLALWHGPVAQWVAHWTSDLELAGSISRHVVLTHIYVHQVVLIGIGQGR